MNKTARNIFRLCAIASKVRRLPINAGRTSYSQIASLPYSSNSKDHGLPATHGIIENQENDKITSILSTAKTPEEIFQAVKQYRSLMKCSHSLQAFRTLDGMYRQMSLTDKSIGKRVEFLQLCEIVISDIKWFDVNDAVYILKVCTYFGIPSTSVFSQSLLQFVRQGVSNLLFHRLMNLQYLLRDFEKTPLSDALLIAIPIMCEIQINNKMIDLHSPMTLVQALLYLTTTDQSSRKMTEIIIDAVREKGIRMRHMQAKKIIQHMSALKYLPPGYQEVLSNMEHIIIQNINQFSSFEIHVLLGKIVKQVRHEGNKTFYNEEFVDACADAAISNDFGFERGVQILNALSKLNHTHIRLIDYLAAKCFETPKVLSQSSERIMIPLVISLALADYKPIFWESMQEIIVKNCAKKDLEMKNQHLNFVVSMAALDFFEYEMIKNVFNENYLRTELRKDKPMDYWNLLLLYQSVKTFYPKYAGPWPPQYMIDAATNNHSFDVEKALLLPALEKALGGSQYVLSNLKSRIGHQIDHVVVMRKGGYPVALNSLSELTENEPITYIEDLQLPAESQVIIIINLPASAYAINSHRLKGNWSLLLKTLEIHTRHTVIPISSMMWTALVDHEKIPYLMQAIRLKCDDISASANV